ncbi:hypothetical protein AZH53_08030 [Methanomicrobiaceae archaeon CYW5]|uniref:PH domain-containing protein n=1 Tax=Methanovulcanius yangii TaxID=1789227 RepID=UPI0029CA3DB5|nr:PH domain-containing protein [Methanovulcanius yangii]MBT8508352.1 hypothetical protein [Methanovulcanius yangii]
MTETIRIGEDFRPEPAYRTYLSASSLLLVVFILFFLIFPLGMAGFPWLVAGIVLLLVVVGFTLIWARLYFDTVVYNLNETEIAWRRGVWFRQTGIVPYNRITNVDILQGPVMRVFGISDLRIQTAGYSAKATAEIRLNGIADPAPLRDMIMGYVRERPPVAAVTGGAESVQGRPFPTSAAPEAGDVLAELREIKAILRTIAEK